MPERSFGRTVRYRRTKLGLSQAKLGELVGRSPSTIRSWERDKSSPTEPAVLHALSAILGVDERSLFEKAGQEPPPDMETSPTVEEALATLSPEVTEVDLSTDEDPDVGSSAESALEEREPEARVDVEAEAQPELAPAGDPHAEFDGPEEVPEKDVIEHVEETGDREAVASVSSPEPGYVAPPEPLVITAPTPRVVEPSYVEDQGQRQLYRVRSLATLVVVVALTIAFLWALGEGLDAIGSWWDDFFGSLRL